MNLPRDALVLEQEILVRLIECEPADTTATALVCLVINATVSAKRSKTLCSLDLRLDLVFGLAIKKMQDSEKNS